MAPLSYLIWLSTRPGLQPAGAAALLRRFGTAEAAYCAQAEELDGLPPRLRDSLLDKDLSGTEIILEQCDRKGIFLLTCQDAAYPECLLQLEDYPLVLYGRGAPPRVDTEAAVAMVGSRRCTPYGAGYARKLGWELARGGAAVVSGLAEGIDAAALTGALQAGGRVISVLAGGVDVIYPACNGELYRQILAVGTLLSEAPPGTTPEGWRFPQRNRIISGLSLGVVVVEAAARSGALITARYALDQGRDVFALPGPADAPMSAGTNGLIARGEATLIQCGEDILEEYIRRYPHRLTMPPTAPAEMSRAPEAEPVPEEREPSEPDRQVREEPLPLMTEEELTRLGDEQQQILLLLTGEPLTVDEVTDRTGIVGRRVNSALTLMQSWGYVQELPGRRYAAAVRFEEQG